MSETTKVSAPEVPAPSPSAAAEAAGVGAWWNAPPEQKVGALVRDILAAAYAVDVAPLVEERDALIEGLGAANAECDRIAAQVATLTAERDALRGQVKRHEGYTEAARQQRDTLAYACRRIAAAMDDDRNPTKGYHELVAIAQEALKETDP